MGSLQLYVVSLERAVERRNAVATQLAAHGVDFVFVDAVDAARTDLAWLRSQLNEPAVLRNLGRTMGDPEIACALSHRLIYRDILNEKRPGGLVLEDDATIAPAFLEVLSYFRKAGPALAHERAIYHLEALSRWYGQDVAFGRRSARKVSDRLSFNRWIASLSPEIWGTCGYYVTREAALSLLASERVNTVADHWSLWARHSSGQVFISVPAAVVHPSDYEGSEVEVSRQVARSRLPAKEGSRLAVLLHNLFDNAKDLIVQHLLRPIAERML